MCLYIVIRALRTQSISHLRSFHGIQCGQLSRAEIAHFPIRATDRAQTFLIILGKPPDKNLLFFTPNAPEGIPRHASSVVTTSLLAAILFRHVGVFRISMFSLSFHDGANPACRIQKNQKSNHNGSPGQRAPPVPVLQSAPSLGHALLWFRGGCWKRSRRTNIHLARGLQSAGLRRPTRQCSWW
jgi:hypothetical protein